MHTSRSSQPETVKRTGFAITMMMLAVIAFTDQKGAVIGGENDYLLSQLMEMAYAFNTHEFPFRIVIHSDQGHEYPADFGYLLNRSIEFIMDLELQE